MAKRWVLSEPTRQRLQSTLNPHVPRTLRVGWWEQRQERGPPGLRPHSERVDT